MDNRDYTEYIENTEEVVSRVNSHNQSFHSAGRRYRKNNSLYNLRPLIIGILALTVIAVLVWGVFALIPDAQDKSDKLIYTLEYEDIIKKYSKKNEIDPALVSAVINAESGFNPEAESGVGAKGLMQMTDETFDWMQEKVDGEVIYSSDKLFDPETCIKYGTALIKLLSDYYDADEKLMLCAYNAGIGNTDSWLEAYPDGKGGIYNIPYPETSEYVVKVLSLKEHYKELYFK